MNHGFIKTAAASPFVIPANCEENEEAIKKAVSGANEKNVRILVLPELVTTGDTCGNMFASNLLTNAATNTVFEIAEFSKDMNMLIILGTPVLHDGMLYNCAAVLKGGKVLGIVPKAEPNLTDDGRWFSPAPADSTTVIYGGQSIPFATNQLFTFEDVKILVKIGNTALEQKLIDQATVVAHITAEKAGPWKMSERQQFAQFFTRENACCYIRAAASIGESVSGAVYDAHNIIAENGVILADDSYIPDTLSVADIDIDAISMLHRRSRCGAHPEHLDIIRVPFSLEKEETELSRAFNPFPWLPADEDNRDPWYEEIIMAQATAMARRMVQQGNDFIMVHVDSSPGSILSLLIAARACSLRNLSAKCVIAFVTSGVGTSTQDMRYIMGIAAAMGATTREFDLTQAINTQLDLMFLKPDQSEAAFEKAVLFARTQALVSLAAFYNALPVVGADMTDYALAWYIDGKTGSSLYNVNVTVPKSVVYCLISHFAKNTGEKNSLLESYLDYNYRPDIHPLVPDKDGQTPTVNDMIGPWQLHDFFLYYATQYSFSPEKIYRMAVLAFYNMYNTEYILQVMKIFFNRYFTNGTMRNTLPDGPVIFSAGFAGGRDSLSDCGFESWLAELDNVENIEIQFVQPSGTKEEYDPFDDAEYWAERNRQFEIAHGIIPKD